MKFCAVVFIAVLLCFPACVRAADLLPLEAARFGDSGWYEYRNEQAGYRLLLPSGLTVAFADRNDPEWSVRTVMPVDYVNFRQKQPFENGVVLFELGVGVHLNRHALSARKFADSKDEGVKRTVRQYVLIRSSEATVAGIKGVRDDFSLEKDSGWMNYSRVVIPYNDIFFVFLGTMGTDKPVAGHQRLFRKIIDSFEIIK